MPGGPLTEHDEAGIVMTCHDEAQLRSGDLISDPCYAMAWNCIGVTLALTMGGRRMVLLAHGV